MTKLFSCLGLFLIAVLLTGGKPMTTKTQKALFAGGCFWCIEAAFQPIPGVLSAQSGYTAGHVKNPSYEQVSTGQTGHVEAVLIEYDPNVISYEKLLSVFWLNIDPTDAYGQFADRGSQYETGIFYFNESQHKAALQSKKTAELELKQPTKVRIEAATTFYPAESYHQNYFQTNAAHYQRYKVGSGRPKRLNDIWGTKH